MSSALGPRHLNHFSFGLRSWEHAGRPPSIASAAFAACVLTAAVFAGCNDQVPKPPRVTLNSTLGPNQTAGPTKCTVAASDSPWVVIGGQGKPVEDGGEFNGSPVAVACKVVPVSKEFQVTARAEIVRAGDASGSVTIEGTFPSDRSVPVKVRATFIKNIGTFVQQDCTVSYATNTQGVYSGRVWGTLSCPLMLESSKSLECEGLAEFKFENCDQL